MPPSFFYPESRHPALDAGRLHAGAVYQSAAAALAPRRCEAQAGRDARAREDGHDRGGGAARENLSGHEHADGRPARGPPRRVRVRRASSAARALRGGRLGVPDRLREHRKPSARPRRGTYAGDGDSARARRRTRANRAAARHRGPCAVRPWRQPRARAGRRRKTRAGRARGHVAAALRRAEGRSRRRAVCDHLVPAGADSVRAGSGPRVGAGRDARRTRRINRFRPRHDEKRARHVGGRLGRDSRRDGGTARAKPPAASKSRPRVRRRARRLIPAATAVGPISERREDALDGRSAGAPIARPARVRSGRCGDRRSH